MSSPEELYPAPTSCSATIRESPIYDFDQGKYDATTERGTKETLERT
jgi:hypothetical protein